GEDDIDAPDLTTNRTPGPESLKGRINGQLNGAQHKSSLHGRRGANVRAQAKPILEAKASAQLRDRLITEIRALGSSDDAATWAHKMLAQKDSLIWEDAQVLEEAFQARLETIGVDGADTSKADERESASPRPYEPNAIAEKPKRRRGAPLRLIRACWRW